MQAITLLFISLITLFSFTGCTIYNPFVQRTSQDVIYDNASTVAVSEPIKSKAMYRATMRPYTVEGIRYTPIIPHIGQVFKGTASWYGPNFHGNKTSNGEYYDMYGLTAAHKTLPMNTLLQVTNLENGASIILRINDRGPFVNNRIIDLSNQAAQELGVIKKGTAKVSLEVLEFDEKATPYLHKAATQVEETITPIEEVIPVQEDIASPSSLAYKVQIVSTQNKEKADALVKEYAIIDGKYKASLKTKTFWQKTHYKVLIGDFDTADEAQNFIAEHYFNGAFVVKD